ncbi:MAG: polymer-forming cytoskeletal protein [Syntrophomonadaceae bacterium]|nr:polymer-forming cytoskeletal protein [Syntrophomonadaceae bacterium]
MYHKTLRWLAGLFTLFLVIFTAPAAGAVEIRTGDMVSVPSGTIKGPLFVSGNNVTVKADVDGDIFAAGQSIIIDGNINGDIIAGANTIRINGNIKGDVRAAANSIDIYGQIEGSVTGAGNNINLREASIIKRDALLFGNAVDASGSISGQAMGGAKQINLNGPIGNDVRIWDVDKLTLGPAAAVNGMVTYNSANEAQIDARAKVGSMARLNPPVKPAPNHPRQGIPWLGVLWSLAAGTIIWGVFRLFFPRLFPRLAQNTIDRPWPTLGWGFLAVLLLPLAALVLMLTVIGIPLALILIAAFIIILGLSKILTADAISRYLAAHYNWEKGGPFLAVFLVTFLVLILITKIPILSFFLNVIIISTAMGMLVLGIYNLREGSSPTPTSPVE